MAFTVLAAAAFGTVFAASATAQAPLPTLSVANETVTEDTGQPVTMTFTVTLSAVSAVDVSVAYATVGNGSATSPADFISKSGTLVIPAGETTGTVPVAIVGDSADEDDETFQFQLSNAQNATILAGNAIATIIDDDAPPTVSVGDSSVTEGTGSNRFLVFTITLSAASSKFVTVDYETIPGTAAEIVVNGTATTGDYTGRTGTLTFSPGLTSTTVSISVRADSEDEADETVFLRLKPGPVNATLDRAQATGTILDDDGPTISIDDVSVVEGAEGTMAPGTFTVSLSAPSLQPITFAYLTADDGAKAGEDYDAITSRTLTIPVGETSAKIETTVRGDDLNETDEKYRVNLSASVNASVLDGVGVATIKDDDPVPTVLVDGVTVNEGTGGTSLATLTVRLSAPSQRTLLTGYATKDGTAVAGQDYQQAAELLTFNPGETSKTISIPIAPDDVIEENEAFEVFVFNTASDGDGVRPVTVTIVDDDLNEQNKPGLSVNDVTVREGEAPTNTPAVFTVSMDRALPRRVRVNYAVTPGSASLPADVDGGAGSLEFAPGEVNKTVAVNVHGDSTFEFNEDFRMVLTDPINAKLTDGSGLGIIIDDDIGGGLLTIGRTTSSKETVKLRDVLCGSPKRAKKGKKPRAPRCRGLLTRYAVAAPGTVRVKITGLATRRVKGKATTRSVRMVDEKLRVRKAGQGRFYVKRAYGRTTERIVTSVRKAKVAKIRVRIEFSNRFGGAESITRDLRFTR